jgi:hypothetical protein
VKLLKINVKISDNKKYVEAKTYSQIFIAALFKRAKMWKKSKCLLTDE